MRSKMVNEAEINEFVNHKGKFWPQKLLGPSAAAHRPGWAAHYYMTPLYLF
jgi:hypothetical protein